MPELPEVETIRKGLQSLLVDRQIVSIDVRLPRIFSGDAEAVRGASIVNATRRGKLLIIKTSSSYSLLVHLKMTGQLIYVTQGKTTTLPDKSTKVIFHLDSGDRLFFNDYRTFGFIQVYPTDQLEAHPFLKKVGIEPFSPQFTKSYLLELMIKAKNMNIKAFLLDQTRVAGIGNIYADEILFAAKILPSRLVSSLAADEQAALFTSIKDILSKGIELRGSSKTSYVDLLGQKGTFLSEACVYQRNGLHCKICGGVIQKSKLVGRGTHFCLNCQH